MSLENIAETAKGAVKVARKALLAVGMATAAATGYADGKEESRNNPEILVGGDYSFSNEEVGPGGRVRGAYSHPVSDNLSVGGGLELSFIPGKEELVERTEDKPSEGYCKRRKTATECQSNYKPAYTEDWDVDSDMTGIGVFGVVKLDIPDTGINLSAGLGPMFYFGERHRDIRNYDEKDNLIIEPNGNASSSSSVGLVISLIA